MFQDHSRTDRETAPRPSPWPMVCGMLAVAGMISALAMAFGN
ncbi:hypothetical protein [Roseibium sp. RKSG952]|nr:hypothetical protein [Roseibium sp. RKSG952]